MGKNLSFWPMGTYKLFLARHEISIVHLWFRMYQIFFLQFHRPESWGSTGWTFRHPQGHRGQPPTLRRGWAEPRVPRQNHMRGRSHPCQRRRDPGDKRWNFPIVIHKGTSTNDVTQILKFSLLQFLLLQNSHLLECDVIDGYASLKSSR